MDSADLLEKLAEPYLARPGVAWGRMFSTTGLSVRGKIFGVVNHEGHLMVKVPESRADALEVSGGAARVVMRGREMREWVAMAPESGEAAWSELLAEAYAYVDAITPS
jgi:TfoX/Sxy family transcriptional regulator of competence genes